MCVCVCVCVCVCEGGRCGKCVGGAHSEQSTRSVVSRLLLHVTAHEEPLTQLTTPIFVVQKHENLVAERLYW